MTRDNPGTYSVEEFRVALASQVRSMVEPSFLAPAEKPQAYLLGGQSGAGKTTLHNILSGKFHHNVIVINGDEYRSAHPRYRELDRQYGPECVKYTAPWAGKMTESLIDAFSMMGYNLVIEGTLRTSEVPMKTATLLRERGYSVSLACMAVKPEISLISCQIRYEQMRLAGTVPRATDPAHHNAIVHDIVDNIAKLEQCGLFDQVYLYNRAGDCLYPQGGTTQSDEQPSEQAAAPNSPGQDAATVLRDVLFGKWSAQEEAHYKYLQSQLKQFAGR